MDRRERADDREEALRVLLDGYAAGLWTALPGLITEFDATRLVCKVQPAIQGKRRLPDGTIVPIELPLLLDCPVVFPSGGNVLLTMPLASGDECLVVFSSRCIDAWWQLGGMQPPLEVRMHDLSDGFVIPGPWSQPRVPADVSTTAAQLRSVSGATLIELDGAGEVIRLKSPNPIIVDAPELQCTGAVTAGHGTGDEVHLQTHTHSNVTPGIGTSGPPVPGS